MCCVSNAYRQGLRWLTPDIMHYTSLISSRRRHYHHHHHHHHHNRRRRHRHHPHPHHHHHHHHHQGFWCENVKEGDNSVDVSVDGTKKIKMGLKSQRKVGAPWTNPAHGRGQVRAVVNTVMNQRAAQNASNFLISYGNISVSPEGLCFVELVLFVGFVR